MPIELNNGEGSNRRPKVIGGPRSGTSHFALLLISLVIVAITGSFLSDSAAKCPPKREKLYTPDEQGIKAKIEQLTAFENDMREVLANARSMQAEDAENEWTGKWAIWGAQFNEASKIVCAGAGMILENNPYVKSCEYAESLVSIAKSAQKCREGDKIHCADAGLGIVRMRLKPKMEKIRKRSASEARDKDDYADRVRNALSPVMGGEFGAGDSIEETIKVAGTKAADKIARLAQVGSKSTQAADAHQEGRRDEAANSSIDAIKEIAGLFDGVDKGTKVIAGFEKLKVLTDASDELTSTANENEKRTSQLIQEAEEKVDETSQKIDQFTG